MIIIVITSDHAPDRSESDISSTTVHVTAVSIVDIQPVPCICRDPGIHSRSRAAHMYSCTGRCTGWQYSAEFVHCCRVLRLQPVCIDHGIHDRHARAVHSCTRLQEAVHRPAVHCIRRPGPSEAWSHPVSSRREHMCIHHSRDHLYRFIVVATNC